VQSVIGKKEPTNLSPFDIDRIRINMLKNHKPQTVAHVLILIKRIINFGIAKQLSEGVKFKIEMPKVDNKRTEDLTPDELKRLLYALNAEPNIQAANFMRMALYTGMRRGELFRLKWSDIDFQRGFINIRDAKGGKAQSIPLNTTARNVLENHPRSESEYVFPGKDGAQRTDFKKPINRIKERAGLPADFRPLHGLRHVFASTLASSGQVDMYTLQKLLTHKSPQMTQRYAHLRDETLKQASNLMGELVEKAINQKQEDQKAG
jgi:integrase